MFFSLMKLSAKLCAILHTTRYTFPALAACHDIKIYKFTNGNTQFKFKNQHISYYTDMKMISISKITTYYKYNAGNIENYNSVNWYSLAHTAMQIFF